MTVAQKVASDSGMGSTSRNTNLADGIHHMVNYMYVC
jgi:hypothetical protein